MEFHETSFIRTKLKERNCSAKEPELYFD